MASLDAVEGHADPRRFGSKIAEDVPDSLSWLAESIDICSNVMNNDEQSVAIRLSASRSLSELLNFFQQSIKWTNMVLENDWAGLSRDQSCANLRKEVDDLNTMMTYLMVIPEQTAEVRDQKSTIVKMQMQAMKLFEAWEELRPTEALLQHFCEEKRPFIVNGHGATKAVLYKRSDSVVSSLLKVVYDKKTETYPHLVAWTFVRMFYIQLVDLWVLRASPEQDSGLWTSMTLFQDVCKSLEFLSLPSLSDYPKPPQNLNAGELIEDSRIIGWWLALVVQQYERKEEREKWKAMIENYCVRISEAVPAYVKQYPVFLQLQCSLLRAIDTKEAKEKEEITSSKRIMGFLDRNRRVRLIVRGMHYKDYSHAFDNEDSPYEFWYINTLREWGTCRMLCRWIKHALAMFETHRNVLLSTEDWEVDSKTNYMVTNTVEQSKESFVVMLTELITTTLEGPIKSELTSWSERNDLSIGFLDHWMALMKERRASAECDILLDKLIYYFSAARFPNIRESRAIAGNALVLNELDFKILILTKSVIHYLAQNSTLDAQKQSAAEDFIKNANSCAFVAKLLVCPGLAISPEEHKEIVNSGKQVIITRNSLCHHTMIDKKEEGLTGRNLDTATLLEDMMKYVGRAVVFHQPSDGSVPSTRSSPTTMTSFLYSAWLSSITIERNVKREARRHERPYTRTPCPIMATFSKLVEKDLDEDSLAGICITLDYIVNMTFSGDSALSRSKILMEISHFPALVIGLCRAVFRNCNMQAHKLVMALLDKRWLATVPEHANLLRKLLESEEVFCNLDRLPRLLCKEYLGVDPAIEDRYNSPYFQMTHMRKLQGPHVHLANTIYLLADLAFSMYRSLSNDCPTESPLFVDEEWNTVLTDEAKILTLAGLSDASAAETPSDNNAEDRRKQTRLELLTAHWGLKDLIEYLWSLIKLTTGLSQEGPHEGSWAIRPFGIVQEAAITFLTRALWTSNWSYDGGKTVRTIVDVTGGPDEIRKAVLERLILPTSSAPDLKADSLDRMECRGRSCVRGFIAALEVAIVYLERQRWGPENALPSATKSSLANTESTNKYKYADIVQYINENMTHPLHPYVHIVKRSDWMSFTEIDHGRELVLPVNRRIDMESRLIDISSLKRNSGDVLNVLYEYNLVSREAPFVYFEVYIKALGARERRERTSDTERAETTLDGRPSSFPPFGHNMCLGEVSAGSISIGVAKWDIQEGLHIGGSETWDPQDPSEMFSLGLTSLGYYMMGRQISSQMTKMLVPGDCIGVGIDAEERCIVFTKNGELLRVFGCCRYDSCVSRKTRVVEGEGPEIAFDLEFNNIELLQLGVSIMDGAQVRVNGGAEPFLFNFGAWREAQAAAPARPHCQELHTVHDFTVDLAYNEAFDIFGDDAMLSHAVVDKAVPHSLSSSLSHGLDCLAAERPTIFRLGKHCQRRDLLHPGFYPFIADRTSTKSGRCHKIPRKVAPFYVAYRSETINETYLNMIPRIKYQWLPTDLVVDAEGKTTFLSYIVGLDGDRHQDLQEDIGRLFALFKPIFEQVLQHLNQMWGYEEGYLPKTLTDRELQVAISVADYVLEPGETYVDDWKYPGVPQDYVIATGIYYADSPSPSTYFDSSSTLSHPPTSFAAASAMEVEGKPSLHDKGIAFRRPTTLDEDIPSSMLFPYIQGEQGGSVPATMSLGKLEAKNGRMMVFSNYAQSKFVDIQNRSSTERAVRRVVTFSLVDPNQRLLSTSDVSEQYVAYQETVRLLDHILNRTGKRPSPSSSSGPQPSRVPRQITPETLLRIAEYAHGPGLTYNASLTHQEGYLRERAEYVEEINAVLD